MKKIQIFVIVLCVALVADVEAGWKFWKKKDKNETETSSEESLSSSTTTLAPSPTSKKFSPTTTVSPKQGIAALADPALAIGVGNTADNIRKNAENQPRKPNPGTEVLWDIGRPKPGKPEIGGGTGSQGYRDWAADLTGYGNKKNEAPKLPAQGPALANVPQTTTQGSAPSSSASTTSSSQQASSTEKITPTAKTATTRRPGSLLRPATQPPTTTSTTTTVRPTSSDVASPEPTTKSPTPNRSNLLPRKPPANLPGPSNNVPGSTPSPPGSKSWAEVAGSGGKTTSKPTLSPSAAGAASRADAVDARIRNAQKTNPTYSKGTTVTDEDLEKLSESLFIKDANNAMKYITLNLQKQTTGNNPNDEAPAALLSVKPEALQIPTIQKVLTIYDNYKPDTRENEYISPNQRQEESQLVDAFLSTNVMSAAMRFLADKGFVRKDYYEYKDVLRRIWFNLYSRGEGKVGSTGFEHVFLTELKLGTEVSGLHNWIYFNAEEVKNRLDYLGYIKKVDLGNKAAIVKLHLKYNGIDKPVSNIFIGTSPELEMALYTVCFHVRQDQPCPVSLGGTKFNIITHKFRYKGKDLIGSAYPEI